MTTETTTTPAVSEAMTPSELGRACDLLAQRVGQYASVIALVSESKRHDGYYATLSVREMCASENHRFESASWPEAFAAACQWLGTRAQVRRNNITRKMALAIISITDEHGSCPEARLRAADFTAAEIAEFHEAARVRAGEMAGNVPFSVIMEAVDV